MPRRIKQKQRQRQKQRHATQSLRQRQSVVVNVNTARSKRARRRPGVARRVAPHFKGPGVQTLIHPQMRYSSEPAVYTTHVRGNAPPILPGVQSNPPPLPPNRQDRALAVDAVRAALTDLKVSRDSLVAAQDVFRNDMAAAAERRRQFNAGGMRGVGQEIELNPDRGAAVAESAEGAALVNPDAGYTELPAVAGPPYHAEQSPRQPDEGVEDEGAEEEKDEGPQQEAKSSGGFGRFRKAVGDFVGSMSPGRRPTARVVPASAERAMRHQREIELAFAPPDHDVQMAAISSSRELRDVDKEQKYIETLQSMQGKNVDDLKRTPLIAAARGLGIKVYGDMSMAEIAAAVKQVLGRKDK
jgi:hypothetical protein